MELAAAPLRRRRALSMALRFDLREIGAWTLGFAPVLYLALRGGGYDIVIRSEVGLAAWWVVILGVLAGILPLTKVGRIAWGCIGLFCLFAIWTGVASAWSASAERTVAELGRLASYLGFLMLGVCALRRDTLRHLITGMGAAFGIVALLAILSRLYPGAFPTDQVTVFFPGATSRLNYPLNYANGTGNFLAIGLPLVLGIATRARTLIGQALGMASVPIAVLGLVMTASRGGVLTAAVGIAVFFALSPDRLPKLGSAVVAAAGSTVLIGALLHRGAVRDGLGGAAAVAQRHQLALLIVVVSGGVALLQVALALIARHALRPRVLRPSRRQSTRLTAVAALLVVVVAIAAGVPGELAHQWRTFKQTDVTGVVSHNVLSRLGTVAGSHRYQYWRAAASAFDKKPLTGIGPGTFEFYWAQHGSIYEFIRNAHSLYLESMAETGVVGLALIAGFLLALLGAGAVRALRAPPLARASLAAATASLAAFCAAAGYDWVWQLPVMPVAALLLGAAVLSYGPPGPPQALGPARARAVWGPRIAVAAVGVAAMLAIAIPFAATSAIRSSQADVRAGHLKAALDDAATAQRLEPYAATPRLQRALILEQQRDLQAASVAIGQAAAREETNWRIWLVRARIDAERGDAVAAVRDYRRAHALNPLSPTTSISG